MTRKCEICGSRWPAMVTMEAYNNRKRMHRIHPGQPCRDTEGEFGPLIKPTPNN